MSGISKVLGFGLPFSPQQSSCSIKTPKNFRWTIDQRDKSCELEVWVDQSILIGLNHNRVCEKKVAWICESSHIVPNVVKYIDENMDYVLSNYDFVFTCDKTLTQRDNPRVIYCPPGSNTSWISQDKQLIYDKTKLCSIIASNKKITHGHMLRHQIADTYKESIDLYGGVAGSPKIGMGNLVNSWHDKSEGLKDYMFSFAIENSSYETYYTEKIMDCFTTGTVPIYWGSPDIGDHFNKDGIIIWDDKFNIDILSEEMYYDMIPAIKENYELATSTKIADDILYELVENNCYEPSNEH